MTLRATYHTHFHFFRPPDSFHETPETIEITRIFGTRPESMDDPMDTHPFKRIANLASFQQQVKNNLQKTYEEIRDVAKRLEKTENVNQALRDENYELNSTNETQNTTIQQKILVKKDQLKKRFFTPFTIQRSPKFSKPEKFGGARDELEPFKFNFRAKLQANGDWYPDEDGKFNYVFPRLKGFAQSQIFFKMDPTNVLKIQTVEFF